MKEIQSLPLTSMNDAAHFMFVSNMADRAEKDVAVKAENENLQISAKSLTTDKIAEADRLRDQLYAGYKKAVGGYANFPVDDMADAAKVLQQHLKDYKIDVQAQLDTLSLGAFVERLRAANEAVRELTGQRTDERSAKTARAVSDEAYRMLVLHVNAHALIEGDADYAAFIDYANTEIAHFKQEVLGGKKGKAKADDAE